MKNAARLLLVGAALFCFYPWHGDSRPAKIKAHFFERIGSLGRTATHPDAGQDLKAESQRGYDEMAKPATSEMAEEKKGPRLPLDEELIRIKEKISSAERKIGL